MSVETLRRAVEAMREDSDERWHAVADWLEVVADGAEELGIRTLPRDRASAVARAYLTHAAATDDTLGGDK